MIIDPANPEDRQKFLELTNLLMDDLRQRHKASVSFVEWLDEQGRRFKQPNEWAKRATQYVV